MHAVVARSTFRSQKCQKADGFGPLLDVEMSFFVTGTRDFALCQKGAKCEGLVACPKTMTGVGAFEEDLERCILLGRRSTRDISSEILKSGCILEYQIFRFAKMFFCVTCSTSYDLASLFVAGAIL